MFITEGMLSKAYQFSGACRGFGEAKLRFLTPEVSSFYLRNMKDDFVKGYCPACGKNEEFFYLAVQKFLGKTGIEISREKRRWDYSSGDVEIDKCSFGNVYFLDGLYRIVEGDDLDELISRIPEEIRKERDELIPGMREELQKNIAVVNMELERRIDLLRKSATCAILKTSKKLEGYVSSSNPSNNAGLRKDYTEISVIWPTF